MEGSVNSVSSNVTVEYTDPSGIFFEVQPLLESILPLRSLHWKSPTRPLRSIDSLQVDFVPADNAQTNRSRASSVPHRRHQIPGLRQTPYVKIYLLRCDDNDTYKTVSRKLVRDWIKDNASANQLHPPNSGSTQSFQDNHDAFEWLIVHVAPEGIDSSPNSALKWTGRATTSVLEKVRADFNGSSKSAVDRVTQLRIPKGGWLSRKTPEQEAQVEDLILKLKFAILTAFSLRINQYEEDIREKDSQRGLPGWNFCTFFMLKEGLVLGFEHVGLYDDALVGYDELAVGLDSALRDQFIDGNQHGGTFLEYDPDIFAKLEDALKSLSIEGASVPEASDEAPRQNEENEDPAKKTSDVPTCISLERDYFPFDAQKKQYREMIMANNISVFDFKVYIFTRQMTLLLKAARYNSPKNRTRGAHADLSLLAEVCDRASEFISYASRTLRHDLLKGLGTLDHACSDEVAEELVDNLVCSWTYAAVSQVLMETTSPLLDIGDLSLVHNGDKMAAAALSAFVSEKRIQLPRRSSSLSNLGTPAPQSPRSPSLRQPSPSSIAGGGSINRTGSLDLAATRGDLFLLARRVLDKVGKRRCWSQRWNDLSLLYLDDKGQGLNFDDVSLDETASEPEKQSSGPSPPVSNGLETPILAEAARSSTAFNQLYEDLTDQLFRHYFSAGRIRSSEMALVDLALSKYRAGDYTTAYRFFEHLTAFYGGHRWFALEGIALELYAECLKKTERMDEYVQGLLKLLANYAGIAQSGKKAISTNRKRQSTAAPLSFSNIADRKITQYVDELLETSKTLQTTPRTQLSHFFGGLVVHPSIVHFDRRDGIGIELSLRFLLGKRVQAKHIKLYLVDPANTGMTICFERSDETVISSSSTKILLEAPLSLHGTFVVQKLEVQAGNIIFTRDFALTQAQSDDEDPSREKYLAIPLYPPAKGLEAKITTPHIINLGDLRTIDVQLKSGQLDVENGLLRIKPATAGLRLRIADASVINGDIEISATRTGQIEFKGLKADTFARINIPYSMETAQQSLAARLEISYDTKEGHCQFFSAASILSILPIGVNVQDAFQNDVLISKYTVSPGMLTPIRLLNCNIPSSPLYEIQSSLPAGKVLDVFPKQPACILYKTIPRLDESISSDTRKTLALTIEFSCLDEESLVNIENKFASDLAESDFGHFARLLVPRLLHAFGSQWTAGDLEAIGLLREINVLSFEQLKWAGILEQLSTSEKEALLSWLEQWHKDNRVIPINPNLSQIHLRKITIPVDVPELQVVHTASLIISPDNNAANSATQASQQVGHRMQATVNEMIVARLKIWHTRRWCRPDHREPQTSLLFTYEILASPDAWVIGGRKRGNFTAEDGECKTFDVFLLPQRSGHLLLPSLEIKSYIVKSMPLEKIPQRQEIPGEVDYQSHATTIYVSPGYQRTTVLMDPTGSSNLGDGNWLIESERTTSTDLTETLQC